MNKKVKKTLLFFPSHDRVVSATDSEKEHFEPYVRKQ
jgi:hypothetical protein